LKTVTKMNKSATIAVAFKQEIGEAETTFKSYIEKLYKKSEKWQPIPILQDTEMSIITDEEVDAALKDLKTNKAVGVDGLADYILKNRDRREMITQKLRPIFQKWYNGEVLPKYLKKTRVITLSKEDGEIYPAVGKIRTIAVAPALMKVYEKVLFQRLLKEIEVKGGIAKE
jgi:hypothetical protein